MLGQCVAKLPTIIGQCVVKLPIVRGQKTIAIKSYSEAYSLGTSH